MTYLKRRLLDALFLATQSLANLNSVISKATVDVHWEYVTIYTDIVPILIIRYNSMVIYTYSAWASALLVLD